MCRQNRTLSSTSVPTMWHEIWGKVTRRGYFFSFHLHSALPLWSYISNCPRLSPLYSAVYLTGRQILLWFYIVVVIVSCIWINVVFLQNNRNSVPTLSGIYFSMHRSTKVWKSKTLYFIAPQVRRFRRQLFGGFAWVKLLPGWSAGTGTAAV